MGPRQFRDLSPVSEVLVSTELEAFAELLVECLLAGLLLRNLGKHVEALLDKVLLDRAQDLFLLNRLERSAQR